MIENSYTRKIWSGFSHLLFIVITVLCIYPIILLISVSISDSSSIYEHGYSLIPTKINFDAYKYILADPTRMLNSYFVTIFTTVVGGFINLLISAMLGYAISRKDFKYRGKVTLIIFLTMLFSGGLVPWYMVITNVLHLKNTLLVLILPYIAHAWYVMMLRTFFQGIPTEMIEAAEIDGCSEYRIFFTIIVPLSKPALAAVGFLILLRYWNDWYLSLLFIENQNMVTLQYLLYSLMSRIEEIAKDAQNAGALMDTINFPSESARMAMAVMAAGPMLFVFPFFQKYFVKGITLGSVKG